jgi:hypothetical protein
MAVPVAQGALRPEGLYFPDDAFFARHGTAIITNQEDQDTIIELAYPSGKVIASYGHPGRAGSAPGYLTSPTTPTSSPTAVSPLPMPRTVDWFS